MDILYTGKVDGFCIVSSDGDFTRLASRLRESQMYVVVMGEEKTPRAIRMACDKFITLENLVENDEDDTKKPVKKDNHKRQQVLDRKFVINLITEIINNNDNNGRPTHLGELGSKIDARYPDFDTRDYGYSTLSKMMEETEGFELSKKGTAFYVSISKAESGDDVYAFATDIIKKSGTLGINIGELSNQIHARYPSFSPKAYGYSQFYKFVSSIPGAHLCTEENGKRVFMG